MDCIVHEAPAGVGFVYLHRSLHEYSIDHFARKLQRHRFFRTGENANIEYGGEKESGCYHCILSQIGENCCRSITGWPVNRGLSCSGASVELRRNPIDMWSWLGWPSTLAI